MISSARLSKRLTLAIAVLVTVFGLSAAAFAGEQNGERDRREAGRQFIKGFVKGFELGERFHDMDKAPWAAKFIMSAQINNIIKGYEDRSFRPNNAVKRQEAVVMAVRALGLEDQAQQAGDAVYQGLQSLPFTDSQKIAPWAAGAVSVAVYQGWLDSTEGEFHPHKAASRIWIVRLLVNAMGLRGQAEARAGEQLPFADAPNLTPEDAGYVAVAMDAGFIAGFENKTFRPHQPVTRAQMAKMLELVREALETGQQQVTTPARDFVISGVLIEATAAGVTVKTMRHGTVTVPAAVYTPVFIDDQQATIADLQPGYLLKVYLDGNGSAVLIDARSAKAPLPVVGRPLLRELKGTVTAVDPAGSTITVSALQQVMCVRAPCPPVQQETTLTVAEDARIKIDGFGYGTLSDVQPGDYVELHLRGETVVKIEVKVGGKPTWDDKGSKSLMEKMEKKLFEEREKRYWDNWQGFPKGEKKRKGGDKDEED